MQDTSPKEASSKQQVTRKQPDKARKEREQQDPDHTLQEKSRAGRVTLTEDTTHLLKKRLIRIFRVKFTNKKQKHGSSRLTVSRARGACGKGDGGCSLPIWAVQQALQV